MQPNEVVLLLARVHSSFATLTRQRDGDWQEDFPVASPLSAA